MTNSKDTFTFNGFEPSNTTPVPDVLFDVLLPHLNEAQLKVMLYVIRRTLGFKKTADAISLNQFRWGITTKDGKKLDDGCGLKNFTTISKALKELEQMNCIESDKRETDEGNKLTTVYRIRFMGTTQNVVGTTDSVVGVLRKTYDRTTPSGGRVLRQTESQETVIQQTDKQETVIQERERIPASESDATFSPPDVGERSQPSQEELDKTFSGKGRDDDGKRIEQNLPTSQPAQSTELLSVPSLPQEVKAEQAAPGLTAPDMSGKWSNETCVAYAEWCNKKRYTDKMRCEQVKAAASIHKNDTALTLDEFKKAYDERNDAWWQEHKGKLHVNDMKAKGASGIDRVHEMLQRIEDAASKQRARAHLQVVSTNQPTTNIRQLIAQREAARAAQAVQV